MYNGEVRSGIRRPDCGSSLELGDRAHTIWLGLFFIVALAPALAAAVYLLDAYLLGAYLLDTFSECFGLSRGNLFRILLGVAPGFGLMCDPLFL